MTKTELLSITVCVSLIALVTSCVRSDPEAKAGVRDSVATKITLGSSGSYVIKDPVYGCEYVAVQNYVTPRMKPGNGATSIQVCD